MGDISIMKLIETARAFAKSIDNGDGMVNETNGEKQKLLFEFGVNDIEDLMQDVFKPSNIEKAKNDPQFALENAKKLAEGVTQLLEETQKINYDIPLNEFNYPEISDVENDFVGAIEKSHSFIEEHMNKLDINKIKTLSQQLLQSIDQMLNYLSVCESNDTIENMKASASRLKKLIQFRIEQTENQYDTIEFLYNESHGLAQDWTEIEDFPEFFIENQDKLLEYYDDKPKQELDNQMANFVNMLTPEEWTNVIGKPVKKIDLLDYTVSYQDGTVKQYWGMADIYWEIRQSLDNYSQNLQRKDCSKAEVPIKVKKFLIDIVENSVVLKEAQKMRDYKEAIDNLKQPIKERYKAVYSCNEPYDSKDNNPIFSSMYNTNRALSSAWSTLHSILANQNLAENNQELYVKVQDLEKKLNKIDEKLVFTYGMPNDLGMMRNWLESLYSCKTSLEEQITNLQTELQNQISELETATDIQAVEQPVERKIPDGKMFREGNKTYVYKGVDGNGNRIKYDVTNPANPQRVDE